jgi:hypothetical protein
MNDEGQPGERKADAPAALEWFTGRVRERLDMDLTKRLMIACEQELPLVAAQLTVPPLAGSPERDAWERTCDRCGIEQPMDKPSFSLRQVYPMELGGKSTILLVTGMLCHPCAEQLGIDTSGPAEPRPPRGKGMVSVETIGKHLPGVAFGVVLGEHREHFEHQVEHWEGVGRDEH